MEEPIKSPYWNEDREFFDAIEALCKKYGYNVFFLVHGTIEGEKTHYWCSNNHISDGLLEYLDIIRPSLEEDLENGSETEGQELED